MNILYPVSLFVAQIPYFNFIAILIALFFAYKAMPFWTYSALGIFALSQFSFSLPFWLSYFIVSVIFIVPDFRRYLVTKPIIMVIKKLGMLPRISDTEKTALTAGDSWVDADLFSGKPNFKNILGQYYPKLKKEEQGFVDKQVEKVCEICDDFEVYQQKDLDKKVWDYLAKEKFFGMIIPKKYGGLEFSAYGHSCVVEKLASRCVPLAITVMVPNSLGPAELLLKYGTKKQKDHYLPRLADGREIPCFALTEPLAGSDATSIKSDGVVFKDDKGEIKIRLNSSKRYISLGAKATLIGLAFVLKDPEGLLGGKKGEIGITCALLSNKTKGLILGRRHDPLATPFINSPINGQNVEITLDQIIGGKDNAGMGWKMLMECLAAGRGISLPSTSCGGAKLVLRAASAHVLIRKQFGASIANFEGISEVMARIIGRTYTIDAIRQFTSGSVDIGAKPAVVSGIAKYHATELFRKVMNDGMDVLAGSAIIRGKRNLLANGYFSVPISITVEGANILTRSLMHFGQGSMMCHPYIYKEIEALENNDLAGFDNALFSHIKHMIRNKVAAFLFFVTRGRIYLPYFGGIVGKYERKLAWLSSVFAFSADAVILRYGGALKVKESLNGRFGDVLSSLYMASAVLRKYIASGAKKDEELIVDYILRSLLDDAQNALNDIYANLYNGCFYNKIMAIISALSRFNVFAVKMSDKDSKKMVKEFLESKELRDRLTQGIYVPQDKDEALGRIENAYDLYFATMPANELIKKAIKAKKITKSQAADFDFLLKEKIISKKDSEILKSYSNAAFDAVLVDEYSSDEYKDIK